MADFDDLFGEELEAAAKEYERLDQALLARLETFMEAEDVDDAGMVGLLVGAAVRLRMADYAANAENPSATGFKADLERFRRDVEEAVREAMHGAEEFIALVKEARAQPQDEPDTD